jgi:hypothetical protein
LLPFLHARAQQLQSALSAGTAVWQRYHERDLGLDAALGAWLAQCAGTLKALSLTGAENECAALQGQWAAAREGIDPFRREAVGSHRRSLRRIVALHVLDTLGARLRELLAQTEAGLAQGRTQLQPIVLAIMQAGLLNGAGSGPLDQARVEALWRRIQSEPGLAAAARQVSLSIALPDVLLLLEELLTAARS